MIGTSAVSSATGTYPCDAAANCVCGVGTRVGSNGCANPYQIIVAIATSFTTIRNDWTLLPAFTPTQLITVSAMSVATARVPSDTPRPVSSRAYRPKMIADPAIPP